MKQKEEAKEGSKKRQEEETAFEGAGQSAQERVVCFSDVICFYIEVTHNTTLFPFL